MDSYQFDTIVNQLKRIEQVIMLLVNENEEDLVNEEENKKDDESEEEFNDEQGEDYGKARLKSESAKVRIKERE